MIGICVNSKDHSLYAVTRLSTVKPEGTSVVDHERKTDSSERDSGRVGESRVKANLSSRYH